MKTITATIVGITQKLDFETGVTTNFLILRLPNNAIVQTHIDDDMVKVVAAAALDGTEVDRQEDVQESALALDHREPSAVVFGGEPIQQELHGSHLQPFTAPILHREPPSEYLQPLTMPVRQELQPNVMYDHKGKMIVPSRSVPKDIAGNPIVRTPNAIDMLQFAGEGMDEDGVASI